MKHLIIIPLMLFFLITVGCDKKEKESEEMDDIAAVELSEPEEETFDVFIGDINLTSRPTVLSERELQYSDISDLSSDELRILRNAIFALHNRRFVSDELQDYFNMFNWYSPMYNDYEISLTPTESANVEFIRRYE